MGYSDYSILFELQLAREPTIGQPFLNTAFDTEINRSCETRPYHDEEPRFKTERVVVTAGLSCLCDVTSPLYLKGAIGYSLYHAKVLPCLPSPEQY